MSVVTIDRRDQKHYFLAFFKFKIAKIFFSVLKFRQSYAGKRYLFSNSDP